MSQTTGCKWCGRFVRERLDGLYDEPRPGAPRQISDKQMEQVIVRTLEETPRGETHWSSRDMAKASGLGRTTVQQIWRAFGLQPHRTETFKLWPIRCSSRRCGTSSACTCIRRRVRTSVATRYRRRSVRLRNRFSVAADHGAHSRSAPAKPSLHAASHQRATLDARDL